VSPVEDRLAKNPAAEFRNEEVDLSGHSPIGLVLPGIALPVRTGPCHGIDITGSSVADLAGESRRHPARAR
jgi:hypothetical protein